MNTLAEQTTSHGHITTVAGIPSDTKEASFELSGHYIPVLGLEAVSGFYWGGQGLHGRRPSWSFCGVHLDSVTSPGEGGCVLGAAPCPFTPWIRPAPASSLCPRSAGPRGPQGSGSSPCRGLVPGGRGGRGRPVSKVSVAAGGKGKRQETHRSGRTPWAGCRPLRAA